MKWLSKVAIIMVCIGLLGGTAHAQSDAGESTGQKIENVARKVGNAIKRGAQKTGHALQRAGHWIEDKVHGRQSGKSSSTTE